MNVVHFITRLIIGGAQENTLLTCIDQHSDYGDKVTLVCGPGLGPEGSLLERARSAGFQIELLPDLHRSIRPRRDWRSYQKFIEILRTVKPDIVHTHSSKAGIMGRSAASKMGIRAVHTIHGSAFHYGQSRFARYLYRAAEKWGARRCDRFISVCDAMTDQYVAAGIASRDRFTTIYSGMDVEPFLNPPRLPVDIRTELGFEPHHVVVGKIARLFNLKGHEFLIRAAPRIVERTPDVRFLLIGDGILREQFDRDIAAVGLTDHFVFTGLVPPSQVPELIGAMDVVVHTSMWEGLARVLPQGLIAGKPVVSYDIDGAREVCITGETGFLLPRGSIDELTDAICELANDPDLRRRLGQTGRERFTDQFRHQTMTRRIRKVYKDILA